MCWINEVLFHLKPVTRIQDRVGHHPVVEGGVSVENWKFRQLLGWTHIGKDQALIFPCRIRSLHACMLQAAVRRLAGRFQDCAVYIEQPAVITTAQTPVRDYAVLE